MDALRPRKRFGPSGRVLQTEARRGGFDAGAGLAYTFRRPPWASEPDRPLKAPALKSLLFVAVLAAAASGDALASDRAAGGGAGASPAAWTESDTRLANHYISLLQGDPSYGQVLNLLWDLYRNKDQTPLLLGYFETAAARGGEVPLLLHGHLLRKAERWEEAAAAYEGVAEINPENRHALSALADLALRRDERARAIAFYERLEPLVPADEEEGVAFRLAWAGLHRLRGETSEAVAIWRGLLAANPSRKDLRRSIVAELLEAGETEAAREALLETAASPDPRERLGAQLELMRLHEFLGDAEGAASSAMAALGLLHFRDHEYATIFARLVQIHERFEILEALESRLEGLVESLSGNEKALHDLAEFRRLSADAHGEEEVLSQLVELLPGDLDYRLRLTRVQMRNDRYDAAAETLESVLSGQASVPLHLVLLRAQIALHADDRAAAEAILEGRLRGSDPGPDEVREVLDFARSNYLDSLVEELLRRYEGEALASAEARGAPVQLARFLHERGRREQAVETLMQAIEAAEGLGSTERLARLHQVALVLRDLDEDDRALELIDRAVALAPERREFLTARVDILVDGGRVEEAVAQLEALWGLSETLEGKAEVDQRLFSLLRGHFSESAAGSVDLDILPGGAIRTLAEYRAMAEAVNRSRNPNDEPVPVEVLAYYDAIREEAETRPSLERRYRAAWWAMKLQDNVECYTQLNRANEEAGGPVLAVERMLLDLAVQNERPTLMVRHLSTLAEIDPENATEYRQRLAETRFDLGFEDEAVRELRRLLEAPDASLATLSALAKVYRRQGGTRKQVDLWRAAYREADLIERRRIVRQLAEALVEDGDPEGALEVQLEMILRESDAVQRSRQFDSQLTLARAHEQLDWLLEKYRDLAQQHPFDRFYPEAIARIHLASGNDVEGFEALKRTRYLSEQGDHLLDELSELADRVGELGSAIYYRRQLLARDGGSDPEQWMSLVEMLEKDLRVDEADQLRRRLEGRFSRHPDFLDGLADEYLALGRLADAERALARLVSLRHWDASLRLKFALVKSERGLEDEAAALFDEVLAATADAIYPPGAEASLPLLRVASLPLEDRDSPGHEFDPWVFAVEAYPFLGGRFQDDLAEDLRRPRAEFAYLPSGDPFVRLRALEEGAALAARHGRSRDFAERHATPERPLVERLWVARHSGDRERFRRLLAERAPASEEGESFFEAYCQLLAGGAEALLEWVESPLDGEGGAGSAPVGDLAAEEGEDEEDAERVPREELARMAAFFLHSVAGDDPLGEPEDFFRTIAALPPDEGVGVHLFTELRRSGDYAATWRLGSLLADGALSEDGNFLFHLSQVAEWAGLPGDRRALLDSALIGPRSRSGSRGAGHFFAALTERLALMDDDASRWAYLEDLRAEAEASPLGTADRMERHILIDLAGERYAQALAGLEELVARQVGALRTRGTDEGETRSAQVRSWQRMGQVMRYYAERLPGDAEVLERFVAAMGAGFALAPEDSAVLAEHERFEIDRRLHRFEILGPAERAAEVDRLLRLMADPENHSELARSLEALGYHRETIPVYRLEAELRARDYSPLQGLLEACSEAMEPGPALEVIGQIRAREFPAPPGLTNDYLIEQHARFLLLDRDLERLAALSRVPTPGRGSRPIESTSHLPYRAALIEAYRLEGRDEELFSLLGQIAGEGGGEMDPRQRLLGADRLAARGKHAEALEWIGALLRQGADSSLERRAIRRAILWHRQSGFPRPGEVAELARRAAENHPPSFAREASLAAHEAGASREAASLLRLLRAKVADPAEKTTLSIALLRLERERGVPWWALAGEWETLWHQFRYRGTRYETGIPDSWLPLEDPWRLANGAQLAASVTSMTSHLPEDDPERMRLAEVLGEARAPEEIAWLPELLLASLEGRMERSARALVADAPPSLVEQILETLPSFGPEGAALCRTLLDESGRPGTLFFPQQPERQISLFHRAGDRVRLLEVHARLMREARSDLFRSHGMEPWYPTLANRQRLPGAFAGLGETDLAMRLYDRYHRGISRYAWIHQPFLEDYLSFLIAEGRFSEAEGILIPALHKSLRLDLRLLVRLYSAWGRLDEWEERTRELALSVGRDALLRRWVAALAEGREMVEYSRTW